MEAFKEDLLYVYCVTNKEPTIQEGDDGINNLSFVYHHGLYAVVSRASGDEFSEENLKKNIAEMEWLKEKVSGHEEIIEKVMKIACVVPFKFPTIFHSEESLRASLAENEEEFKGNLERLAGKEEWGLKIYCDMEKLKKKLLKEDAMLMEMDKEIGSSLPGKAFFLRKKKEEALNALVHREIREFCQDSFERLRQRSLQSCINRLLPKEITEREDDMVFNSAFLVDRNEVPAFINTVNYLKSQGEESGFSFVSTGPWPPYNFCENG